MSPKDRSTSCGSSTGCGILSSATTGLRIDFKDDWHSEEGGSDFTRRRLDGGWLDDDVWWLFVHGENSTRFRLLEFEEPGKDAGESGGSEKSTEAFGSRNFRREEVDGGLGGRSPGTDMFARSYQVMKVEFYRESR